MVNDAISLYPFLIFETNLRLYVICILQGKNIELCRHVITSSPIDIMPLRYLSQAINVDALFLPVILVYKFHILKKF